MPFREVEMINKLQTGDLIAIGGTSALDIAIKSVTKCNVSAIGVVYKADMPFIYTISGINDFVMSNLSLWPHFAASQEGSMWVLPLAEFIRTEFDEINFRDSLFTVGSCMLGYKPQHPEIDKIKSLVAHDTNYAQLYGVEFILKAYKQGFKEFNTCPNLAKNNITSLINLKTEDKMPADAISLGIFADAIQIKGPEMELFI